jgi:hypothetical protein
MSRFSQLYLPPADLAEDSTRMRVRLAATVQDISYGQRSELPEFITRRIGVRFPQRGGYPSWEVFFTEGDLRDVLDAITVIYDFAREKQLLTLRREWLPDVRRIFQEERVRYRVDNNGVVHFAVDEEFERTRQGTLAGLSAPRYSAARGAFEHAYEVLAEQPPNGKLALRGVFEALEITFKLFFPRAQRLGGSELRQFLKPEIDRRYARDAAALRSAQKLHNSLVEWVDGIHFYRHGQGVEEPTQPPLDVAILGVSTGAAFLRWLLEFDSAA